MEVKPSPLAPPLPHAWRGRRPWAALARRSVGPVALQTIGFAVAIGLWEVAALLKPATVPTPAAVGRDLLDNFVGSVYLQAHGLGGGRGYWYDVIYTTRNVLVGVGLGTAIGVALGLLSVPVPVLAQVLNPIAATFGAAPILVAPPVFRVWFGVVPTAQVLMVAFYTALLLYIFSRRAADNVAAEYLESAVSLGAKRLHVFRWIFVPGTVPELVGALRIALAGAWGLEAIAELLGAQHGIGFLINFYAEVYGLVGMTSLTLLLGCVAIVCDGVVVLASRTLLRWTASGRVV